MKHFIVQFVLCASKVLCMYNAYWYETFSNPTKIFWIHTRETTFEQRKMSIVKYVGFDKLSILLYNVSFYVNTNMQYKIPCHKWEILEKVTFHRELSALIQTREKPPIYFLVWTTLKKLAIIRKSHLLF